MTPRLVEAKYVSSYTLSLKFSDGAAGEIDLKDELVGRVFEPLKDIGYFQQFRIDSELHTLVWPNGADLSPEFLYEKVSIAA
jgi:hypothetical protein